MRRPDCRRRASTSTAFAAFVVFAALAAAGCASTPEGTGAAAEPATLADLQARGAVRMTAEAARAATVGTRLQTSNGSAWNHDPDGSLSMLVRQRDRTGLMSFSGRGTWRIGPSGAYCVDIAWQSHAHTFPEAWCVDLYTLDGVTWAARRVRGGTPGEAKVARVRAYRPIVQDPVRP
jgi:hypothetical protein